MIEQFFFNAILMFVSPKKPTQDPANSLLFSFFKKVLEYLASWIAGFFAFLVILILLWIFSRMRRSKACISVASEAVDRTDVNRIYIALAKKNNQLRYLLDALPPLWLSTFSDVKLSRLFHNTNLDRETVNLKLGPTEIKQAEKIFYRFFLRGPIYKLYFIRINLLMRIFSIGWKGGTLFSSNKSRTSALFSKRPINRGKPFPGNYLRDFFQLL